MNFKNSIFALAFIISSGIVAHDIPGSEEQLAERKHISEMLHNACEPKQLLKIVVQDSSNEELEEVIHNLLEQNKLLRDALVKLKNNSIIF